MPSRLEDECNIQCAGGRPQQVHLQGENMMQHVDGVVTESFTIALIVDGLVLAFASI